jgi:calcium-dependent protein kinase
MITPEQLGRVISTVGDEITVQEIKNIIKSVDYVGNGMINYSEFISATISAKTMIKEQKIYALFKHFDSDDSGVITINNIKEAMNKTGKDLSGKELKLIMSAHDLDKNGTIDYNEFKRMLGLNEAMACGQSSTKEL